LARCAWTRTDPAGDGVVVRYPTTVTSERYLSEQLWRTATLEQCPLHPEGGCGLCGHGSYGRVRPVGVRVARLLCPKAGVTISLLPDFLASRLSGTLSEVEAVVEAAENAASQEAALEQTRPAAAAEAVTLPSGLRWLRRLLSGVHAALVVAVTLVPSLSECRPTLAALRERLGATEVLVTLRQVADAHLSVMSRPLGFRARARKRNSERKRTPHEVGPDPPRRDR
jgi:hypothetical protein